MKQWFIYISIVIVALAFYVATIKGVNGNPSPESMKGTLDRASQPFELSPERGRYALVISLAENGTFALSNVLAQAADPDIGYYKGHFYIYFAPGVSVLALPLYKLGALFDLAQVASFMTIALFAVLNIILLYTISKEIIKLPTWIALLVGLTFGFGCSAWSYAVTLYQHQVTTFFLLSGFYAVWRYQNSPKWGALWMAYVWLAYGFAIFIDYPNLVLLAPVIVYAFFISIKKFECTSSRIKLSFNGWFLITSIVFLMISGVHAYYNYKNFGDWKRLSGSLVGIKEIRRYRILEQPDPDAAIEKMGRTKQVVRFFTEDKLPRGVSILLFSRDRGLFLYAPVFLLGVWGMWLGFKKKNQNTTFFAVTVCVHLFLYGSWGDPWGGWAFGPRYLIPSMAILSMFIGIWLQYYRKLWASLLFVLLFVYSSAIAVLGALTTNAVPPKIEGDYLKIKYNFLHNLDFLIGGQSSSYLYNNELKHLITLENYFFLLWGFVLLIMLTLVLIGRFQKSHV